MAKQHTTRHSAVLLGVLVLVLSSCSMAGDDTADVSADTVEEVAPEVTLPIDLAFVAPVDCNDILPESSLDELRADGLVLVAGPGSPSADPIYVEGQTPEELIGGLSCLFAPPGDIESGANLVVSVAAVSEAVRPDVISAFLDVGLNVGQTTDGSGLTYWRWGDDVNVTALHNSLYKDSWYSALMQPGGRDAYDRGVALVDAMRAHTTR
jgi:hypothetical protein